MNIRILNNITYQKTSVINGPVYGLLESCAIFKLDIPSVSHYDWKPIDQIILGIFDLKPRSKNKVEMAFHEALLNRIINASNVLQEKSGLITRSKGKILGLKRDVEKNIFIAYLALPFSTPLNPANIEVLNWALESLRLLLSTDSPLSMYEQIKKSFDIATKKITNLFPQYTNTSHFIRSAIRLHIPYFYINNQDIQYGWGNKQSVFTSTILESTSSYAVTNARDKYSCANILRLSGMPVPNHFVVKNINIAKKNAIKMGYPVVVKPADLDGGVGVFAGIRNEDQLTKAYEAATAHSSRILLEKHIEGEDYRLIVFDGEMVWAIGRQPAGVTGNGIDTVSELVKIANQDKRRGYSPTSTLRPILLDQESIGLLSEQEMNIDSIPTEGLFVKLKRAANISSGGLPVVLTDKVHPENVLMVERSVKLLNLDLAGVDFISPDISQPWYMNNAAIIEINAKPQLVASSQTHLYQKILQKRVLDSGRIPIVIIDAAQNEFFNILCNSLKKRGVNAGFASKEKCLFADGTVMSTTQNASHAVRSLLLQRDTECVIFCCEITDHLYQGLPVDRFDFFIHGMNPESVLDSRTKVALSSILTYCNNATYQHGLDELLNLHDYGLAKHLPVKRLDDIDAFLNELTRAINRSL